MRQNFIAVIEMFCLTGAGWTISLQEIETAARIVSVLTPAALSVALFIHRKRKDRKNGDEK